MRDAVGSTWVFSIVVLFTLIFAGFLVLVLSYSRAYKIKNEITSMIEKYEGLTDTNFGLINDYLANNGYKATGACQQDDIGVYINGDNYDFDVVAADSGKPYLYCIKLNKDNDKCNIGVTVFYKFNLPVLGKIGNFSISGQTNTMPNAFIQPGGSLLGKCTSTR